MEAYTWANAACDAAEAGWPDEFCRGECNAALTSTSTGCDANNVIEAHAKTMADDNLLYCSSCEHLYTTFKRVCRRMKSLTSKKLIEVYCNDECNAAIKAVQTGCDEKDSIVDVKARQAVDSVVCSDAYGLPF